MDVRKVEQDEWLNLVQKGLPIEGVDLSNIDLAESDLDGVRLVDCLAMQANYTSAQLAGSHWMGCQLPASTFASGQLQGTVFENCRFLDSEASDGCKFRFCNMVDACFRNCDLSLAAFYSCDLYNIAFETCRMRGASVEKSEFSKSFGRKVVRTSACFKDCDLEYAALPVRQDCRRRSRQQERTHRMGDDGTQRELSSTADNDRLEDDEHAVGRVTRLERALIE